MKSKLWLFLWTAALIAGAAAKSRSAEANTKDADAAWKAVQKALRPPTPPAEWQTNRPSAEEIEKFQQRQGRLAAEAADRAKDFYTRFPNHPKAAEARKKEYEMAGIAARLGSTDIEPRLAALEAERAKDPGLNEDERFELRARSVQRAAMKKQSEGIAAVSAEMEKGARSLLKEFPERPEVYGMLLQVASNSECDQSRKMAHEIVDDAAAPDDV